MAINESGGTKSLIESTVPTFFARVNFTAWMLCNHELPDLLVNQFELDDLDWRLYSNESSVEYFGLRADKQKEYIRFSEVEDIFQTITLKGAVGKRECEVTYKVVDRVAVLSRAVINERGKTIKLEVNTDGNLVFTAADYNEAIARGLAIHWYDKEGGNSILLKNKPFMNIPQRF